MKKYLINTIIFSICILIIVSFVPTRYFYRIPIFNKIFISLTKPEEVQQINILTSEQTEKPIWTKGQSPQDHQYTMPFVRFPTWYFCSSCKYQTNGK